MQPNRPPTEGGGVILPTYREPPLPLEPRKEPLYEPAAVGVTQGAPVLGLQFAGGPVRGNQVDSDLLEVVSRPLRA
jgi:hypothetical protein